MKRIFDLILLMVLAPFVLPLIIIVALVVLFVSGFPILYWSNRMGRDNQLFRMPKFRTMVTGTPVVATDRLRNPSNYLIPMGGLIRRLSLDELPQLWSILVGEMSFVGPRPALFNQHELIKERSNLQVHTLLPGLTGWAQVNGRDALNDQEKVAYDYEYLRHKSLSFDIKIILLTALKVIKSDGISH